MKLKDITSKKDFLYLDIETHAENPIVIKGWGMMSDSVFTPDELRNTDCSMIYCPFIDLQS